MATLRFSGGPVIASTKKKEDQVTTPIRDTATAPQQKPAAAAAPVAQDAGGRTQAGTKAWQSPSGRITLVQQDAAAMRPAAPSAEQSSPAWTQTSAARNSLGQQISSYNRQLEQLEAGKPDRDKATWQAVDSLPLLQGELDTAQERVNDLTMALGREFLPGDPEKARLERELAAAQADVARLLGQEKETRATVTQEAAERQKDQLLTQRYEAQAGYDLLGLDPATLKQVMNLPNIRDERKAAYAAEGTGGYDLESQQKISDAMAKEDALKQLLQAQGYDDEQVDRMFYYAQLQHDAETTEALRQAAEDFATQNGWTGAAATIASVPMSLGSGLGWLAQTVDSAINATRGEEHYRPLNYNRPEMAMYNINDAIRGGISGNIQDYWTEQGHEGTGKVLSFLYQTGTSMLDSTAVAAITAGTGLPAAYLLGGGAATQSMMDAKRRGATDGQAVAFGFLAGVAEEVFENLSIEHLLSLPTPTTRKGVLLNAVLQAIPEASEEVNTSIANMISDALIMGDKSEIMQMYKEHLKDSKDEKEASSKTFVDVLKGLGIDALGGGLSGGLMGGLMGGVRSAGLYHGYNKTGQQLHGMNLDVQDEQAFVDEGLASSPDSEAYQLALKNAKKLQAGEHLTDAELGAQYQENVRAVDSDSQAEAQEPEEAESGEAPQREYWDALLKDDPGDAEEGETEQKSPEERLAVLGYTVEPNRRYGGFNIFDQNDTLIDTVSDAEELGALADRLEGQAGQRNVLEMRPENFEFDEEEEAARAEKERYELLERNVGALGEAGQESALRFYETRQDPAQYREGFGAFYQAGLTGASMDSVRSRYAGVLTEEQKQAAWNAGRTDAITSLRQEKGQAKSAVRVKNPMLVPNSLSAALPEAQRNTLDRVAKVMGVRVELVETLGESNGYYDRETGTIKLAADAVKPLLTVFSHEVTHRLQDVAPEEYRLYRDYALQQVLEEQGEHAVQVKIAAYAEKRVTLSTEQAMDELVSDYTRRLVEEKGLFERLAQEQPKAARGILDALKDFLRKVWSAVTGNKKAADAEARRAWGADLDTLEQTVQLWENAFRAAEKKAGKLKVAQESETAAREDGGVRHSLKEEDTPYNGRSLIDDPEVYSYDFLTAQKAMHPVTLPEVPAVRDGNDHVDPAKVIDLGMKNARALGTEQNGKVFVKNTYTGRQIQITVESIRHGLSGDMNRLLTNGRLGAVIGEVAQNAIPINALHDKAKDVSGTYALAGYAADSKGREFVAILTVEQRTGNVVGFESYDSAHSINGRRKRGQASGLHTGPRGFTLSNLSDISIADFLQTVKQTHQSILSEDVLLHLGETRNPGGEYASKVVYSLKTADIEKELAAAVKENQRLRQSVEDLRQQMKRTVPGTVKRQDVEKAARSLIKTYEAQVELSEIAGPLKALYDYMGTGRDGANELTFEGVQERAEKIARTIAESALTKDDETYRQYSELRSFLRGTKLHVPQSMWADLESEGGYDAFRKTNMGRLRLSSAGGSSIDSVYQELSQNWPEFFSEGAVSNPADQLIRIADVVNSVSQVTEYNPFSYNMEQAVSGIAGEILDSFFDIPQMQTWADRQALSKQEAVAKAKQKTTEVREAGREALREAKETARQERREAVAGQRLADDMFYGRKLEQARQARREAVARAVERERAVRSRQINALLTHFDEMRARRSAMVADSRARTRLLHIMQRLNNKKLPAVNRALLNEYIGDIDLMAKSITGQTIRELSALRDWYEDRRQNDPDFISDPATEERLARLGKKHINDLSAQEVSDLTGILLYFENQLRTERRLIDSEDRRDTYLQGLEVIRNVEATQGSKGGPLDRFIVTETLSPLRQVRRLTGYVDSDPLYRLTQDLARGQRDAMAYEMRAGKPFEKYAADKKFSAAFSGKGAEGITLTIPVKDGRGVVEVLDLKEGPTTIQQTPEKRGAVTITITPAMRAALYLHSLNDQNLKHIAEGGITVPDWQLYRRGNLAEAYARGTTVKLSPSAVREICRGMTEQERAFAREVHRYFNEVSKPAINEVSEKLKGYSIAGVEHYFPINTDSGFTRSDFESLKFDGTIEGMGFLKERVNAANPILLRDANAVLEQAIQMHAKYVGMAIPVRNFNKVWGVNKSSFNADGSRNSFESSVQKAIGQHWGKAGLDYIEKMMSDLQSGMKPGNVWAQALSKVRSKYAGAVLTLNASVAMKQAASYPTAAAVLGWRPLARAMGNFGRVDLNLIAKYTPLQWYRSKGFSTKELGDLKRSGNPLPTVLNWVQGADVLTTRKLWKASEYYVRQHDRGLNVGTEAYYKAVAEVYNRVIEETQPNYTTMQRPQLLRSDDSLMANLAMFKTQPFQNFNVLYDAAENLIAKSRQAKAGAVDAAALKEARQGFRRAVSSQLAQLAVFAGMTAAWAFFRGRKDKYKDEDGEVSLESFLRGFGKDVLGGLASIVPFGSDAWEFASSQIFGDKYYGVEAVTVSAISDTLSAIEGLGGIVKDMVKAVAKDEKQNWNKYRLEFDKDFDSLSKAFGLPYENVANLFNAVARQVLVHTQGPYLGEYLAMKMTTDPDKKSASYYDLLFQAMGKDGAAYRKLYGQMVSDGWDEGKLKNAMESRMKKAQGVTKASEMDQRWLSPEQQDVYDGTLGQMTRSDVWARASAGQREKAEEDLYALVTGSSAGQKLQEKIDGGRSVGLDDGEYILYRMALSMVDEPNESGKLGTYTNDEVQAAIEMLAGLSDAERSYLWGAQGKSEKSDPWR